MNKKVVIGIVVGGVALIAIACCVGLLLIGRQASRDAKEMEDEFGSLLAACEGGAVDGAAAYTPGSGVHPTMGVGPGYGDALSLETKFMKASGWKPRRLRRGGKPARRRRAKPFAVVYDQRRATREVGRASGL